MNDDLTSLIQVHASCDEPRFALDAQATIEQGRHRLRARRISMCLRTAAVVAIVFGFTVAPRPAEGSVVAETRAGARPISAAQVGDDMQLATPR